MKKVIGVAVSFLVLACISVAQAVEIDFDARSAQVVAENADVIQVMSEQVQMFGSESLSTQGMTTMGSAPPVSYLEFTGVISDIHSTWEDIAASQFSTVYDHGGSYMYLEVLEMGYGYDYAYMNGLTLPKVQSYSVTDAYGVVIGFINYYDASGLQGGQASVKSTSMNSPWNTMWDYLTVQ